MASGMAVFTGQLIAAKVPDRWLWHGRRVLLADGTTDTLTVRELDVGGKVLITMLLCPKITPKNDLKALYKRRWNVELDIRKGMKTLSCKTPPMGEKGMWVYLLAYNLIRLIMP